MNPTPTLSGKEADDFFERVAEGLKYKADFTPGLEEARKIVIINQFASRLLNNSKNLDRGISEIVDQNFWDLM